MEVLLFGFSNRDTPVHCYAHGSEHQLVENLGICTDAPSNVHLELLYNQGIIRHIVPVGDASYICKFS